MRLLLSLLLLSPLAFAQSDEGPHHALAELLGGPTQIQQIHQELIDAMLQSNPAYLRYQPTIESWAQRYVTADAIHQRLAAMYSQFFTDAELYELLAFYRGETGSKALLLMPTLAREADRIGQSIATEHKQALVDMLREANNE